MWCIGFGGYPKDVVAPGWPLSCPVCPGGRPPTRDALGHPEFTDATRLLSFVEQGRAIKCCSSRFTPRQGTHESPVLQLSACSKFSRALW